MENCKHEVKFTRMSYPAIKQGDMEILDSEHPSIETYCADCGRYLKIVNVLIYGKQKRIR